MKRIYTIAIIALFGFWLSGCDSNSASPSNNTEVEASAAEQVESTESENVLNIQGDEKELQPQTTENNKGDGKVRYLTTNEFLAEIFDYNANPTTWVYKGNKPAIIDFYATWCGPCKKVAPIMDELAAEYTGQVNFFKIDTDKESKLAGEVFRIRSIPSILYIPVNGQPMMYPGLMTKEKYIELINNNLLK